MPVFLVVRRVVDDRWDEINDLMARILSGEDLQKLSIGGRNEVFEYEIVPFDVQTGQGT